MSRVAFVLIIGILITCGTAPGNGAAQQDEFSLVQTSVTASQPDSSGDDPAPAIQTEEEALAQDLALIAKSNGWTMEEATADHAAAKPIGDIAVQVAEKRPDIFVGSELNRELGKPPALYIKGPADDFISDLAAKAATQVKIVDNQPYSFDELEERKLRVHNALVTQGFRNISIGFSVADAGDIVGAVTREAGVTDDPAEILSGLPEDLRASVMLTVNDAPVVVDESAFGGMQLRVNGSDECTSGWSVWNAFNTTGVTTAGHCNNGINQIVDPASGTHASAFQAEHRGQWGDVEWYTSTQVESAQFYATPNIIRYVKAVEPRASISQNEQVCLYGRASNVQNCLAVLNVSLDCTNGGVFNDRLVLMNGDVGIGGDSGGPWYSGTTAFGSHKGGCDPYFSGFDSFSVADLYDEALGVRVRVSHTLGTNDILWPGDRLTSQDGRFVAAMQTDGNFVVYRNSPWTALWATSQCGQTNFANIHAVMQNDGNFVLYPAAGTPARWAASWPQNQPACLSSQQTVFGANVYMVMQNDGNLVMYKPGYGAVWASQTCCY